MPFWDRKIDLVVLSHPQKDHLEGLISVFQRFAIGYFVHSDINSGTDGYYQLMDLVKVKNISEKKVVTGEKIDEGVASLSVLWPSAAQLSLMHIKQSPVNLEANSSSNNVLSATSVDVNNACVVVDLNYGIFDAIFTGDADSQVDPEMVTFRSPAKDGIIEVLKVPHHGSKTGMTDGFIDWVKPLVQGSSLHMDRNNNQKSLAVISVGKNTYGHPAPETISSLEKAGFQVERTDQNGDIEVMSDGKSWEVVKGQGI
jgi:competence protein ComEC